MDPVFVKVVAYGVIGVSSMTVVTQELPSEKYSTVSLTIMPLLDFTVVVLDVAAITDVPKTQNVNAIANIV